MTRDIDGKGEDALWEQSNAKRKYRECYKPGTHGCHEALHMASFLANAIDEELVEHGAVKQNPEWLALAKSAVQSLADLYQKIGSAHL